MAYSKPLVGALLNPLHPLSRGLVGYWLLGEGGGSRLNDSSFSGNTASISGAVNWIGGHAGGLAPNFASASSQYAEVATLKNGPLFTGPLTMSIWMKPVSVAVGRQIAFTIAWDNGSSAGALDIEISPSNQLQVVKWSAQVMAASSITPPAGAWTHVLYTQDAGTNNLIYINGAVAGTATAARNLGSAGIMRLASFNAAFPTPYFNGGLDDALLYNRYFPPADAAWLYAESYPGFASDDLDFGPASGGGATFNPGWAYGATKSIGAVF